MRALLQRVSRAEVRVGDSLVGAIEAGMLVLLGVAPDDDEATAAALARRTAQLRIFADTEGRTNLSVTDIGGAALVVSQFTLYADTRRGRRPSFVGAAEPALAERLYEAYCLALMGEGVPVQRGRFGAKMAVDLVNEGPFTILLDTAEA